MYVNCIYCGFRYGRKDEVPVSHAAILKHHIINCPEHPLSKALEVMRECVEMIHEERPTAEISDLLGGAIEEIERTE